MHRSAIAVALGLLVFPATATAAGPAAQSRAAWERVGPATFSSTRTRSPTCCAERPPRAAPGKHADHLGARARWRLRALRGGRVAGDGARVGGRAPGDQDLHRARARRPVRAAPAGPHATRLPRVGAVGVGRLVRRPARRRARRLPPRCAAAPPFEEPAARRSRGPLAPRAVAPAATRSRCASTGWRCSRTRRTRRRRPGTTTAAKVVLVNRLNQVYEQDLAIRLMLVAGNDQLNLDTAAAATGTNGPCGAAACYTAQQLQSCEERDARPHQRRRGADPGRGQLRPRPPGHGRATAVGSRAWAWSARRSRAAPARRSRTRSATPSRSTSSPTRWATSSARSTRSTAAMCAGNLAATQAVRVEPGSGTSIMAYAGHVRRPTTCRTTRTRTSRRPRSRRSTRTSRSAEESQPPVQQVALNGFGGGDSFALSYNGATSAPVTEGGNFTANGIQAAIEGIAGWPAGATVTVDRALARAASPSTSSAWRRPRGSTIVNPAGLRRRFAGVTAVGGRDALRRHARRPPRTARRASPSSGAAAYTIPARTPFLLDATGSDLDGDLITYLWEQNDPGGGALGSPLFDAAKADGPLFRIFGDAPGGRARTPPAPSTSRSFPDIDQVLADNTNAATGRLRGSTSPASRSSCRPPPGSASTGPARCTSASPRATTIPASAASTAPTSR